jgi:hypothetical protein
MPDNNPLERILREIRRRTRVVGAFPDGQSALNLAAARLRHIAGTNWSNKRYLNIEPAEGSADERCHHRLSQYREPLSPIKCAKNSGHYQRNSGFGLRSAPRQAYGFRHGPILLECEKCKHLAYVAGGRSMRLSLEPVNETSK